MSQARRLERFRRVVVVLALTLAGWVAVIAISATPVAADDLVVTVDPSWDAPDPGILVSDDEVWIYTTNTPYLGNVPVWQSTSWGFGHRGDALPTLGTWARPGLTWAPGVARIGDRFVLYYTATDRASDRQCLGMATAELPEGPFVDSSPAAMICQIDDGGSIDAQPFQDEFGDWWLIWKSDGNRIGCSCRFWTARLDAGGRLDGVPTAVALERFGSSPVIENPSMAWIDGRYLLLYSTGDWAGPDYATVSARCAGPSGPCVGSEDGPLLQTGATLAGPGGASSARRSDGTWLMAFHAYDPGRAGYPEPRLARVVELRLVDGRPELRTWTEAPPTGTGDCRRGPAPGRFDTRHFLVKAQVYRLYCAAYLRYPDDQGFSFWLTTAASGGRLEDIADLVVGSPEFLGRYGSTTNDEFVVLLYRNVLARDPDDEGLEFWVAGLDAERISRGQTLLSFSESAEFRIASSGTGDCRIGPAPDLYQTGRPTEGSIYRLYCATFVRYPDPEGFAYWLAIHRAGSTLVPTATAFARSPEFVARYGDTTATEFVALLYGTTLGREADDAGLAYWSSLLTTGRAGRGEVLLAFSDSREFRLATGT